ncbi:MAG TPA: hypothetical protein VFS05_00770 [Gemmatimonadaceae bacterium]|nr:hypothetical protein [Gemmatimonadaceae bacterium]
MDDKQLAKLIKKTSEKAAKRPSKARRERAYDSTLPPRPDDDADVEREQFFDEMKKREF